MSSTDLVQCCCGAKCQVPGGMCQYKHKCVDCHRYLHIICGEAYHDSDGNEVEDLAYSRVCYECSLKRRSKRKLAELKLAELEEGDASPDEDSIQSDNFFTEEERRAFQPGWYIPLDLEAKDLVKNRFKKPRVGERTQLEGKIIEIPASYWVDYENYWKEDPFDPGLKKLEQRHIEFEVVLYGKIIKKNEKSVMLFCLQTMEARLPRCQIQKSGNM